MFNLKLYSQTVQVGESDDESVKITFFELIPIVLKDPDERKDFFMVRRFTCSSLKSLSATFKNKRSKRLHAK